MKGRPSRPHKQMSKRPFRIYEGWIVRQQSLVTSVLDLSWSYSRRRRSPVNSEPAHVSPPSALNFFLDRSMTPFPNNALALTARRSSLVSVWTLMLCTRLLYPVLYQWNSHQFLLAASCRRVLSYLVFVKKGSRTRVCECVLRPL